MARPFSRRFVELKPEDCDFELRNVAKSDEKLAEETKTVRKQSLGCSGVLFLFLAPLTFYYFYFGGVSSLSQFADEHSYTFFFWTLFFFILSSAFLVKIRRPKLIVNNDKMGRLTVTGDGAGNVVVTSADGTVLPMTYIEVSELLQVSKVIKERPFLD